MTPITIDPAISGHKKVTLKTKGHGSKAQKNKNSAPHDVIYNDMKIQKEELLDIDVLQGQEHYDMVKPLRKEKQTLRHRLIEDKLESINFHTYETHETADLIADLFDSSDEDMDDAFADFIG